MLQRLYTEYLENEHFHKNTKIKMDLHQKILKWKKNENLYETICSIIETFVEQKYQNKQFEYFTDKKIKQITAPLEPWKKFIHYYSFPTFQDFIVFKCLSLLGNQINEPQFKNIKDKCIDLSTTKFDDVEKMLQVYLRF